VTKITLYRGAAVICATSPSRRSILRAWRAFDYEELDIDSDPDYERQRRGSSDCDRRVEGSLSAHGRRAVARLAMVLDLLAIAAHPDDVEQTAAL
jgi:hypothetical protein